jgi:hypothetical protein
VHGAGVMFVVGVPFRTVVLPVIWVMEWLACLSRWVYGWSLRYVLVWALSALCVGPVTEPKWPV